MKPQIVLETARTKLRQFTADDAQHFYDLNNDPLVMEFTGEKPFGAVEEARTFLLNYDQYNNYGVGRLAVMISNSDQFIGWCGLKYTPDKNEYDIGFRFKRTYWNQGFATETASKCLEYGFNHLNLSRIVGRAMKENAPSIRVLCKIGMTYKQTFDFSGREGLVYEITKNDYQAQSIQ